MLTSRSRSHYIIELSCWVFLSTSFTIVRFISQRMQRGSIKKYRADDWLMLFCLLLHVMDSVSGYYGILNLDLIGPINTETENQAYERLQLAAHYFWTPAEVVFQLKLWCLKGCVLLLYARLTVHHTLRNVVKAAAVYTIATFLVLLIYFFAAMCRPFSTLWTDVNTSTPGECQTWRKYYIMQFVFNISSDLIIISIPITLLSGSTFPATKKLLLCGLFSLGSLVMICATINKIYTISYSEDYIYVFWSYRETNLAMLVANLPLCWTLFRKLFSLKSFNGSTPGAEIKEGESPRLQTYV